MTNVNDTLMTANGVLTIVIGFLVWRLIVIYNKLIEKDLRPRSHHANLVLTEEDFTKLVSGHATCSPGLTTSGEQITCFIILSDIGYDRMLHAIKTSMTNDK